MKLTCLKCFCGAITGWAATASGNPTPHNLAASDFVQDWSNTGLITASDDWSGVPSLIGYRGDNLTFSGGADPQSILVDGTLTPIDVNANRSDPSAFTTGGLAEFDGIANPTLAMQGSNTAGAPFLLLFLDCSGVSNVVVRYLLWDIDAAADNAVMPFALQYRVGSSGNFINLPQGFVADATTGPSQATLETPVQTVLPDEVNGQLLVQVRIITANAAGNDEEVGVDDIRVSAQPVIQSLEKTGTHQFELSFTTRTNNAYQVEASTNLIDWSQTGAPITGDGTVKTFNTQTNLPSCFWRVWMTY